MAILVCLLGVVAGLLVVPLARAQPTTTRLSVSVPPEVWTSTGAVTVVPWGMTRDGTVAVMISRRQLLPEPGAPNDADVFIRDVAAGTTTRIAGLGGAEPNGDATWASISGDGR